jgi:hypothetical protein
MGNSKRLIDVCCNLDSEVIPVHHNHVMETSHALYKSASITEAELRSEPRAQADDDVTESRTN